MSLVHAPAGLLLLWELCRGAFWDQPWEVCVVGGERSWTAQVLCLVGEGKWAFSGLVGLLFSLLSAFLITWFCPQSGPLVVLASLPACGIPMGPQCRTWLNAGGVCGGMVLLQVRGWGSLGFFWRFEPGAVWLYSSDWRLGLILASTRSINFCHTQTLCSLQLCQMYGGILITKKSLLSSASLLFWVIYFYLNW